MVDTLVAHLSEDAWNGDAQCLVTVDGVLQSTLTVTTPHGSDSFQDFTITGDFGAGPHTVELGFANDAWGGSADTDRNLYVGGITFNGTDYAGETAQNNAMNGQPDVDPNAAEMYVNGSVVFQDVQGAAEHTIVGTEGDDDLTGTAADETINGLGGNDHIDGGGGNDTLIGGPGDDAIFAGTGTADGGTGNDTILMSGADGTSVVTGGAGDDHFEYRGANPPEHGVNTITDFVAGAGGEVVRFADMYTLNADYAVGPFLFDAIYTRMHDLPEGGTELDNPDGSTLTFDHVSRDDFGADNFASFQTGHTPPGPDPVDTLVLHLAEDAWSGDANFRLLVDGHEMTGALAVTTAHGSGFEDFTYTGQFGTNPHTVEVKFVNDAWGGSADTDRNLYVDGITYNGTDYAGQSAQNNAQNGQPDADPNAAEMYVNGSVVFQGVTGGANPPPSGDSTVVLHLSEDAFNGDAQFVVSVDGVQQGDARTVTASHDAAQVQDVTIVGDFGAQGPGKIDITFLNDAYGGSPDADRNLYVRSIDVNGVHFQGNTAVNDAANGGEASDPGAAVMQIDGTAEFNVNHTAPPEIMG